MHRPFKLLIASWLLAMACAGCPKPPCSLVPGVKACRESLPAAVQAVLRLHPCDPSKSGTDCFNASANPPACADSALPAQCINKNCYYAVKSGCPCYVDQVQMCDRGCANAIAACRSGVSVCLSDGNGGAVWDTKCQALGGCPTDGQSVTCNIPDPACPVGTESFACAGT